MRVRLAMLFLAYASISGPAYAYLDPATGSIIIQTAIGVVATWFMYSRMYLSQAKSYLARLFKKQDEDTCK